MATVDRLAGEALVLLRVPFVAMMVSIIAVACGNTADDSEPPSLEASLQAIAGASQSEVIDLSVPFDRLEQGPLQLQAVYRALQTGSPGIYVMRYSDDTLRETLHVFVIDDWQQVYVKLTTAPGEEIVEEQLDIHDARYEEATGSLILNTQAGLVRLTPLDVTPAGA